MRVINYNQIEAIFSDNSIVFNGDIYRTKEDIKLFPAKVTLIENMSAKIRSTNKKIKKSFCLQ